MSEPVVLTEVREGVATVTLNRPEAMNALSWSLRCGLVESFEALARDETVDVVILTGAGERAFCAGLDLKELSGQSGKRPDRSAAHDGAVVDALDRLPQPVIGAINGFAITGGFELALACDVLIGSSHARFADTHARVGIMPGWGLSQKLSRLIGISRAKELSLTGNFIDAELACAWGLLNRVVAPDELLPVCEGLARDMQSARHDMVVQYKRVIDEGFAASLGEGLEIELRANRAHAGRVTPEEVAAVQARGRSQSDG